MQENKKEQEFRKLISKYIQGNASEEEIHFLNAYYEEFEHMPNILDGVSEEGISKIKEQIRDNIKEKGFEPEWQEGKEVVMNKRARYFRAAAVVGLIVAAGLGYYFISKNNGAARNLEAATVQPTLKHDALPGGNRATLTLADGTVVNLDSTGSGMVTKQGNVTVIKLNDGQLSYQSSTPLTSSTPATIRYNTISTPRGGQYQLLLADGSKVWLNAATTLRFPIKFTTDVRKVFLEGEAYFEVAKNAEKPFRVAIGDNVVEVLGTHFNINSYQDEGALKATLLEGSVKVITGGETALLTQGEQAQIRNGSSHIRVANDVNLNAVMAWKNGKFLFEKADIHTVMRQIHRWYDLDITYQGIVTKHFGGTISRNVNASKVLEMLEMTGGVNFEIIGSKVIVMP